MPISYSIDRDAQLITEVWTGVIQAADLADYWKRYLEDPEVLAIRRTVVDLREAVIRFTGTELDSLIRSVVEPALGGRDWKTAIVIASPLQKGISRQYGVFAQRYSKDAIFESIEEARNWIRRL